MFSENPLGSRIVSRDSFVGGTRDLDLRQFVVGNVNQVLFNETVHQKEPKIGAPDLT